MYDVRTLPADTLIQTLPLAPGLRRFFGSRLYLKTPAHGATAAFAEDGTIVGLLRYSRRGIRWLRSVRALGTYVAKQHRGKGIALALWRAMLDAEQPRTVRVTTVSKGGHGTIQALQRSAPNATIIEHCLA